MVACICFRVGNSDISCGMIGFNGLSPLSVFLTDDIFSVSFLIFDNFRRRIKVYSPQCGYRIGF